MPILTTAQGALFYAQRGAGHPALVCLHGAGGAHQHWGLQLLGLHTIVRVLALDLPGHGRSPGPGRATIADYSSVLLAALDALELEQVFLAGHSMGGAIALWTALHAPTRVAGLVLAGTSARLPILPAFLAGMQHDPPATIRLIVERVYDQSTPAVVRARGEEAFLHTDPHVFYSDLLACNTFDVRSRLGDITCPTLILCGENDEATPLKCSQWLHAAIPTSELVVVPHAGHMLLFEQPAVINAALHAWLHPSMHT